MAIDLAALRAEAARLGLPLSDADLAAVGVLLAAARKAIAAARPESPEPGDPMAAFPPLAPSGAGPAGRTA